MGSSYRAGIGAENRARLARNVGVRGGECSKQKPRRSGAKSWKWDERPDPLNPVESVPWDEGRQPLVTTGCGYLPIGALPTGYLPIGALPTGGAGGGGSLRGRSAAAATLSIPKGAAVSVRIFSIVNPPLF